jgi:hypothetical protein
LERDNKYIKIYDGGRLKYEHVVIMERLLERPLLKGETIHHINGIKNDNRIENLFVCSREQHDKAHGMKTVSLYRLHPHWVPKDCVKCGITFYGSPRTMKDRKRCSVSCKPKVVDRRCDGCDTMYTIPIQHINQWTYCSRNCRRRNRRDRDKERPQVDDGV